MWLRECGSLRAMLLFRLSPGHAVHAVYRLLGGKKPFLVFGLALDELVTYNKFLAPGRMNAISE